MEDCLATARTDVDDHAVVPEPRAACDLRDEIEHPLCLIRGELGDVAERVDVPLRQDEQMCLGLGVDVADRNEAVALGDVVALLCKAAEKAIVRQRECPPP